MVCRLVTADASASPKIASRERMEGSVDAICQDIARETADSTDFQDEIQRI